MTYQPCHECGFELYHPLPTKLTVSHAGIYSDARFPGRTILVLDEHHEHLDEVPAKILAEFVNDIATFSSWLRTMPGVERINVSILGNAEPHVHAHLIPRRPSTEPEPKRSPWDDPRPRQPLTDLQLAKTYATLSGNWEGSHW